MLTVVIPVHNRADVVLRTLRSVEAQNAHAFTVVLVDNASTDGSLGVMLDWADKINNDTEKKISVDVITCPTPGAAAARNAGLDKVKTPWVMFFDSDDIMLPGHIDRVTKAISHDSNADIIGWDVDLCNADGSQRLATGRFEPRNIVFHNLFHGAMSTQRYAARTQFVRQAGGWNSQVRAWDDIELGNRMLLLNPKIKKITGKSTVKVFYSSDSVSEGGFDNGAERYVNSVGLIRHQLPPHRQHWAWLKLAILAADLAKRGDTDSAHSLMRRVISQAYPRHKPMLRFAFHYTRLGGRGIARILQPFI